MQWLHWRWPVLVTSFILALALLWGGQWAYSHYAFHYSLKEVMQHEPNIAAYEVKDEPGRWLVEIKLKGAPADLPTFYRRLSREVGQAMGQKPFALRLVDQRDKVLEEVYYRSQFPIYQALAQGCYTDMAREVQRYAAEAGVQARMYLDDQNFYLTLVRDNHFLVAVIPRAVTKEGAPNAL
ncbi:hypothetical protein [Desulfothermobacter acidiphilus]|uniref:hypothetical protein n=1 Tax=Desulfothermobacter acidiphilus TaxID=1938353 RepID=UPI003F89E229